MLLFHSSLPFFPLSLSQFSPCRASTDEQFNDDQQERVLRSCAGEMEREVSAVLSPLGIEDSLSRRVAGALLSVEASLPPPSAPPSILRQALNVVARRPRFSDLSPAASDPERARLLPTGVAKKAEEDEDDKGLTAFLLKFGEGLEETTDARLFVSAFVIGTSYLAGGLVPLLVRPLPPVRQNLILNPFFAFVALLLHPPRPRRPLGLGRRHVRCPPPLRSCQDLLHRCRNWVVWVRSPLLPFLPS
jgi:hypothetical protein